jgi:large subunit ribosomal protein L7/L12
MALGFATLMLIGVCAILPNSSHASPKPSSLVAEVAFNPAFPALRPEGALARPTALRLAQDVKMMAAVGTAPSEKVRKQRVPSIAMQSTAVDEVMEALKKMTLLEASELVKAIEETFDVDASAGGGGMMMAAPVAGGAAPAEAAEAQTEFDLTLESFPADKKIAVLKLVRAVTGLGLKDAKEFVESAPKVLKEGASKEECETIKKDLEGAGAVCSMK